MLYSDVIQTHPKHLADLCTGSHTIVVVLSQGIVCTYELSQTVEIRSKICVTLDIMRTLACRTRSAVRKSNIRAAHDFSGRFVCDNPTHSWGFQLRIAQRGESLQSTNSDQHGHQCGAEERSGIILVL